MTVRDVAEALYVMATRGPNLEDACDTVADALLAPDLAAVGDESLTPTEFARQMRGLFHEYGVHGDTERCLAAMNHLMCDTLTSIGYGEGVSVYRTARPK